MQPVPGDLNPGLTVMVQYFYKRRILHLDGNWKTHVEVKELIERAAPDCEVVTVTGDTNAIQLLESEPFDLVIVDPWAAEKAGFEVCGHLLVNHPYIPVFFYSRRETIEDPTLDRAPGAHVFFLEHENDKLLRAVATALE
jgi:DNA-binding NarL/FixJ family response regulator